MAVAAQVSARGRGMIPMHDKTTIDRKSAEEVLAIITNGGVSGDVVMAALASAISRKIGSNPKSLPKGKKLPARFERFFDVLFDVGPIDSALPVEDVIHLAEGALRDIEEAINDCIADGEDDDMIAMYQEDAKDYGCIIANLKAGDIRGAVKLYYSLDTASRDYLWSDDKNEQSRLFRFLDENREL